MGMRSRMHEGGIPGPAHTSPKPTSHTTLLAIAVRYVPDAESCVTLIEADAEEFAICKGPRNLHTNIEPIAPEGILQNAFYQNVMSATRKCGCLMSWLRNIPRAPPKRELPRELSCWRVNSDARALVFFVPCTLQRLRRSTR